MELENTSSAQHSSSHPLDATENFLEAGSPVKQYALASILIVLAALIAVNFVSSRVERESVISRLETEALGPAKVSTFRIVLDALAGQQVARVDILDSYGKIIYSTDPYYIGDDSEYALGPNTATGDYVGAAAVSGLDGHTALIEAVITRVPVFTEGQVPGPNSHETTLIMYRDVSTAIDAATAAGAKFRFWMVIGVMAVVFVSLMIVVVRGHRVQTEARLKLEELLIHEHLLVSELDQRNVDLKSADEARLRMLSVVTHELGNPLTSISAFASMLSKNKEGRLSDRDMRMVDAITRGETQMRTLVKDLLDLSRVEANEMELDMLPVEVKGVVDGVLESMKPIFENKSQQIVSDLSDVNVEIVGDHSRLVQVVTNLLSNASKYSPEDSTIRVSTRSTETCSIIEISDAGIGISDEDQRKLFTPFFRAENSETRQVPGTGLGLVICKQIVELHGGVLKIRSARGRGTTVRIEVPISERAARSFDAA